MALLATTETVYALEYLFLVDACLVCLYGGDGHGIKVGNGGVHGWFFLGAIDCVFQGYGKVFKVREVGKFHSVNQ